MNNILVVVLVGFSFLLINAVMIGFALFPTLKARKARTWPTTLGQVESSEITWQSDSDGGTSPYPDVKYRYEVNGQRLQSDRIMPGGAVGGQIAYGIVKRYPVGSTVTVYYNPEKPSDSLLESRTPGYVKFLWISVVFVNLIFCCCGFPSLLGPLLGTNFGTPMIQSLVKLLLQLFGVQAP